MTEITINQPNTIIEEVSNNIISKLYNVTKTNETTNQKEILFNGRLHTNITYEFFIEYLQEKYKDKLYISANKYYVYFEDAEIRRICNLKWSSDGVGCTTEDLKLIINGNNIETIGQTFRDNQLIQTFNEFDRFINAHILSNYMFYGCTNLRTINLNNITNFWGDGLSISYAFYGCTSLEKIYMPLITELGKDMFTNCSSLKYAIFPSVQEITRSYPIFYGCINLEYIQLGKIKSTAAGDTYHRKLLFGESNLSSLKVLDLGDNYQKYGYYQCYKCTALRAVIIRNTDFIPQLGTEAYGDEFNIADAWGNDQVNFYVPDNMVDQYVASIDWSNLHDRIKPLSTFVLSDYIDFEIPEIGNLYDPNNWIIS